MSSDVVHRDPYSHACHFELVETREDIVFARINKVLFVVLLGLAAYILFSPFYAELDYAYYQLFHKDIATFAQIPSQQAKTSTTSSSTPKTTAFALPEVSVPDHNAIVIPKIGVDTHILEGTGPETLNNGLWRRPKTSTPDKGGNTVITGHRFLYSTGNKTFYHLDKLQIGDPIIIYWKGKSYGYRVTKQEVVPPTAVEIEDETQDDRITLYTCTPLWSSKNRLVITAEKVVNKN
jgi:LPXTG-site transpeptidase (sortase) family protein